MGSSFSRNREAVIKRTGELRRELFVESTPPTTFRPERRSGTTKSARRHKD